jgi:hypothetical protein
MKFAILALAIGIMFCSPSSATNLIVGGDFESPTVTSVSYLLDVTPSGWTGAGDLVTQGFAGSVNSGDGNQWFDLNPGTAAGNGISQVVNLTAGTTYLFSFLYNGGQPAPGWTTAIAFTVSAPSATLLLGSVSTATMNVSSGTPWASYSSSFTTNSDSAVTVAFQPNGIWANGFIDAVSVSAVPEMNTATLMFVGLAAFAATCLARAKRTNP